jgi:hypothetical protein
MSHARYAVYVIYQNSVTLWYVHDGFYGVNITVWEPKLGQFGYNKYYYSDLVQIKPYTCIEETKRTQLAQALNIEIFGSAIIAIAPVFVQIVDIAKELAPKTKK